MRSNQHYKRSFVIQFLSEANAFEGRVEHVASGDSAQFATADELIAFLARVLDEQKDLNPPREG